MDSRIIDSFIKIDNTIDINKREIVNKNNIKFIFYYNSFLTNNSIISRIITSFIKVKDSINCNNLEEIICNNCIADKIEKTVDIELVKLAIFNGDLVLTNNLNDTFFIMDVKNYPIRSLSEPETEKVVRGSRDGFNENLTTNLALIRRRIKSEKLCIKLYEIGKISKTKVALVYLENKVSPSYLKIIKEKLNNIDVTELTMSDKALEELIVDKKFTPYPLVKYTERPDTFAIHLYQGMFGLIIDTSPSAIIGPVSLFDHLQHAEEFRQTIVAGSYLRVIRFIGIILSFFSIPLWYALSFYNLPNLLLNIYPSIINHNTLFLQLIIVLVGIELIRMASIHTPNALSTSMGLVSGLIIGDVAIHVGLFSEILVILAAISAIGSYITPSYELSLASKMANIFLLIIVYFFKLPGLIIGTILLIIYLAHLKSFGRPYLYPLIPFNFKDLLKQMVRISYNKKEKTS